ncbi:MAG: FAD-dependent oxidoreductase [Actinomycetota bacterium]|nr:FAD-dependent oxidoreductase [Actinomycetota bacterium]
MKVVVLGAGVGGLSSALALARAGNEMVVLERDTLPPPTVSREAPEWQRPGIPHFLQPHAFLARAVKELRRHAPDVYQDLLDAGAEELRLFEKIPPSSSVPEDKDLVVLGCRRPVIEWVLRRAVSAEPNVEIRSGTAAVGLLWNQEGSIVPRAVGVLTPDGPHRADLVIDATGRSSSLNEWIVDGGGVAPETRSDDCGIVYYSRYFRFRPGHSRPEGPWLLGPRAELGYLESGTFWGDNSTFAVVQQIGADDRRLRLLRHPEHYMASLHAQPALASIVDEDVSEPITTVLPMGQLQNTFKQFVREGHPVASGVIAVGDARCHTNPRYAWGLSLAAAQGFLVADLVPEYGDDPESLALAFNAAADPWAATAFRTSVATDNERKRYWSGEPIDFRTPSDGLQLFLLMVFPLAGMRDPDIFRKAVRRLTLLDDPQEIESDRELLDRAAAIVDELFAASPPPPAGPARNELIEILGAATTG